MGYGSLFGLFQFLQTTTSHNFFPFKFTENDKDLDKDFYKVGQLYLLQNRASVITKWENFHITKQGKWNYKVGRVYKVGQLVLQKGETFITKWGWYC